MANEKAKLYAKILAVVSKMEAVEKSGYNNHQKYSYSTEEDLVNSIRKLLIEQKLLVLTSSETKEIQKLNKPNGQGTKETLVTVVNTKHKFIDTETGEAEEVTSTGTGWDDTDKGSFKAITGAMKYFISKNFLVPGKDDAEDDGLPKEPKAQQAAPPASSGPRTFNKPAVKAAPAAPPPAPEEPKEELIKPAATPVAAPKTFARRTTAKEPNF